MQISLSEKFRMTPTLIILAALALMCSIASMLLFGELMLPLAAASLAALFVFERGRVRFFSISVPVLAIAADLLLHGVMSYIALETVAIAVIIAFLCLRVSKAECSFWITLTVALFVLLAMFFACYSETKQLSVDAFFDYYIGLYEKLEDLLGSYTKELSVSLGISPDRLDESFASSLMFAIASMLPSFVIIFGFAVSGVSLKLFTGIVRLLCDKESERGIVSWRFSLSSAFYIAFWISLVLNFILGFVNASGSLAIIVANVFNVLLYVFAYVGIGVVVNFLTTLLKNRTLAIIVTVGAFFVLGSLAVDLIAYFGASFMMFNRFDRKNK